MFDNLTDRLANSFKTLQGKNKLSESNIKDAIREVRRALLEADVALEVIKIFLDKVQEKALGLKVNEGLNPSQAFVKLVETELTEIIGGENKTLDLRAQPPAVVMVAGLQGAGKTTSIAKLARYLKEKENKKVLLVSADVYRPAAITQLEVLAKQVEVDFFPSSVNDKPEKIVARAKKHAQKQFFDVLLVDTAGRLHIDSEMMAEIQALQKQVNPIETLFVVDAMTGQDAAHTAKAFADALPLTGVILTKTDGDARGGAALSVRHITGKPIKFLGVGEKVDALEPFHPDRIVSRLLGMGDVLSLIEEIEQKVDRKKAEKAAKKMAKGQFDLEDMRDQLLQMEQMGGVEALMDKMPGMGQIPQSVKNQMMGSLETKKMVAIINSMTPKERTHIKLIKGSRKNRIAKGSGTQPQDINKLIKQFEKMQKQMKKMSGGKMQKMMAKMAGMQGKEGGMPDLSKMKLPNMGGNKFPF
ncbi:Signal recognition particle, subunit Ffh SRP54 (TC 3.A.5.1.1) [Bathymodiolus thermophilus thioautotrophic gill symbiont]|uniref:Signal recognition particle protein n=1 Tax=Bathymodiolus thermophilus thioautotrophic gill symbiont TaxID=2360 RepID=A0A1J5TV72_9GAMM|nr:signal recognition particle protein [Bathymodiolus thermophilus thioautotrophic gill symbiont]OIR24690.1 signal recognition particle protein [Bathymodiolus thermophilus thioautotrophic gill symbiont]CAB5498153.1 Signal recognition particle protein Ffh [Bathymodiolus thermophilus thioautotrophic gill symbiont]CAB5503097.1 Signal recognition particle protein Ffh [Bathymodiolus thermophilus thioautotrophic gill symbiont]SHA23973.1 Signal recognition particle, subunit Ffh SRP54 (TC 3.A.5.1.1) [B